MMRRHIYRHTLSAAVLTAAAVCACAQTQITLDPHSPGRVFDGLGAVSAGASSRLLVDYPEKQRNEILDYLFKPNYGASLQHLKVEVGADVNSTDGSEPSHMRSPGDHNYDRGYEWWLMEEAKKRNPNIILDVLPWGAPGWVGRDRGKVYSPDMAEYMADFIAGAKAHHGLDIQYAGIWNEKTHNSDYVKMLRKALDGRGLKTKIVCCDELSRVKPDQWGVVSEFKTDPEMNAAVSVVAGHYPRDKAGKMRMTEAARESGKPLWSSEDQPNPGGGPFVSRDWPAGGKILAHLYNANYIEGRMTKTEIWSPVTSYYDNLAAPNSGLMYANTPWSGYYDVQSTIWVTAHTTQFAQPGWRYLDSASGALPGKGTYVTLTAPAHGDWSMVLETIGADAPQAVRFRVLKELKQGVVHVWQTDDAHTFVHVGDVRVRGGVFQYTFAQDALYSLTTTTGQGKGTAKPPAPAAFPMPFADDFEQGSIGHAAKFLADQNGAFEVQPCAGRIGHCLEQVITERPTPWGPSPNPFTIAGDEAATDYTVSADARLDAPGSVALMARVDSADVFKDQKAPLPAGYVFTVKSDGTWELVSTAFKAPSVKLAGGASGFAAGQWHHLMLAAKGAQITATVDGLELARVNDSSHTHGMFALGTGWNKAQFYRLAVVKAK